MDKISKLLQEAKPLYIRRQRQKYAFASGALSLVLACGLWVMQPMSVAFDEEGFDNYVTALYLSDSSTAEDGTFDSVVPTDSYGLYEVI